MPHEALQRQGFTEPAPRPVLALTNLLNDLDMLRRLTVERLSEGDVLNAYLLAAGMEQITEDYLHRDPLFLRRAALRLRHRLPPLWAGPAAGIVDGGGRVLWQLTAHSRSCFVTRRWHRRLHLLVIHLAELLVSESCWETQHFEAGLEAECAALAADVAHLPKAVRRTLLRFPTCFRLLDQSPADLESLAERFASQWPNFGRRLAIVGIRTSGSYLAPLLAAFLRRLRYADVIDTTLRPGQPLLRQEAATLRQIARSGGMALLIDDPPRSWKSVADTAHQLRGLGFAPSSIPLMLQVLPSSAERPKELADHPAVLLPWEEWRIVRFLCSPAVRAALIRRVEERAGVAGVRLRDRAEPRRGHASAVFEVELSAECEQLSKLVEARGVGLGYFGEHSMAVAERLQHSLPDVYGVEAGVLYQEWVSPERGLSDRPTDSDIAAVAGYLAARSKTLALDCDLTERLRYRGADWQWCGPRLAGVFGRAAEPGRVLATEVARRLLEPASPALIDGQAELHRFARVPGTNRLVKTGFDVGVFSNLDLFSFDPVSDVARAAITAADSEVGTALRREFESATGRPIDPERWALHQMVHIEELDGARAPEARVGSRLLPGVFQRYYAEVLLPGLSVNPSGPLCAIDVDGVLEDPSLGFPTTSPLGALALRALTAHGFRPVLATGRSLAELKERCRAYGLAGGVAEYGGVVFESGRGTVRALLTGAEHETLDRLRRVLDEAAGVHVDQYRRHSVRAFHFLRGQRRALPAHVVTSALEEAHARDSLRAVQGFFQTDFVPVRIDKALGLRALAGELGVDPGRPWPLALAVGDTEADLGMLALAEVSFSPANADSAVRTAGVAVLRRPNQAGLADAVAELLGHPPGGCGVCAAPPLSARNRLLLGLLGLKDQHGLRKATGVASLTRVLWRLPRGHQALESPGGVQEASQPVQ